MRLRTRFAPSPTGLLHVGNAYSALQCQQWASHHDGELLLRIEDIDTTRCRPEFTDAIIEDLEWLGLTWVGEIRKQSEHIRMYANALAKLRDMGVIYPCYCTRSDIQREIARMATAPHADEHTFYPGTCRDLRLKPHSSPQSNHAWRLDIDKAMKKAGLGLTWKDDHGRHHPVHLGSDVVIGRKDIGFSYHLAVVVDDALQGITHVIRGRDLIKSTGIHRLIQALLDLEAPTYIHHELLLDCSGQRLSKRNLSTTLHDLRLAGVSPALLSQYLLKPEPQWPFNDQATAMKTLTLGRS